MSDRPDLSEGSDLSEATRGPNWTLKPVVMDGGRYCRPCHAEGHLEPNHPDHPNSPYCKYHFRQARNEAKRRLRQEQRRRRKAVEQAVSVKGSVYIDPEGYIVLKPEGADALRRDLAAWQETVHDVATALGFAGERTTGQPIVQRAAQDLGGLERSLEHWREWLAPDQTA